MCLILKLRFPSHLIAQYCLVLPTVDGDDCRTGRNAINRGSPTHYTSPFHNTPLEQGRIQRVALVSADVGSGEHEDGDIAHEARGVGDDVVELFHKGIVEVMAMRFCTVYSILSGIARGLFRNIDILLFEFRFQIAFGYGRILLFQFSVEILERLSGNLRVGRIGLWGDGGVYRIDRDLSRSCSTRLGNVYFLS